MYCYEDKLAVRDFVTNGGGDPTGALADAALVAGWIEVAAPKIWGHVSGPPSCSTIE